MFSRNSFTEICASDWNNIWPADACPLHSSNKKAWNSGRMGWERGTTCKRERERQRVRGFPGQKFSHFFHFHNSYENISIFHRCILPFLLSSHFFPFFSRLLLFYHSTWLFFLSPLNPQGQGLAKCDLSARKTAVKTTKLFNVRLDYLTQFIKTSRYYIPEVGSPREEFLQCFFDVVFFSFYTLPFFSPHFLLLTSPLYSMRQCFPTLSLRDTFQFILRRTTTDLKTFANLSLALVNDRIKKLKCFLKKWFKKPHSIIYRKTGSFRICGVNLDIPRLVGHITQNCSKNMESVKAWTM